MCLTYLHALMLFRQGIRNGDCNAADAGKEILKLLFFARNHPNYREILAAEKIWRAKMPSEVVEIIKSSFAATRLNNFGHYQGRDTCLEEINKNAISWVTAGVPSDEQ